uniref:Tetratricopeptide repeat protein n=1 Tax=Solibacter usitatus (strain Ellin6076) TaxID=234267 RepID=Q02DA2_SOLUE
MEQPDDSHLTPDEISVLIDPAGSPGIPAERAAHAQSCDRCKRNVAMQQEWDTRLHRLAGGRRRAPSADCPPASDFASLAAGLTAAPRSEELLAHAAQCDACGAILHAAVEDFSMPPADVELQAFAELPSSSDAWQLQMARKMVRASGRGGVVSMPRRSWLAWAAGVAVAIGASWMAWQQWGASDPARLIAEAYSQQRPFEFRIPEAGYSDLRVERGAGGSSFQRPPALLEAEAKVARELAREPDSVKWLSLRARAEMLTWDPGTAILTLQRALDRKPGDPDLTADLGMAYALRADADKRDLDYAYAIDYLGRSLKVRPDSRVTVFNRAIVYERMHLNDEAAQDWRHYLELDPFGPWRDEARRRLNQLDAKKNSGR